MKKKKEKEKEKEKEKKKEKKKENKSNPADRASQQSNISPISGTKRSSVSTVRSFFLNITM